MRSFSIWRIENIRWIIRHRAWTPFYLIRFLRFLRYHWFGPKGVVFTGFVFLGKGVELTVRRGFGRIVIEPWVHIGDHNRIRAHEGTVSIGTKSVLGRDNTINAYLHVSLGAECVISDSIYICDFDHRIEDLGIPIRKQGIVKSPVVIESDVWIGTKATILRGARIEHGAVIGAHSVVKGVIPQHAVAVGVPARIVRSRIEDSERTRRIREHQEYIAAQVRDAMSGYSD